MPQISSRPIMAMLIVIVILILPAALPAQSFWLEHSKGKTFLLEIFKPPVNRSVYNGESYPVDYSFETVALFFSLRLPVGSKTSLVAELPFAHAAFDTKSDRAFSFYHNSGRANTIGSPYLGFELGSQTSRVYPEVGIRLPLIKAGNNYAADVGKLADSDRREAFEHTAALRAMLNVRLKYKTRLSFRFRGGSIIQRDADNSRDIRYRAVSLNARVGYETARISFGVNTGIRWSKVQSRLKETEIYEALSVIAQVRYEMARISLGVNTGLRMSNVRWSEVRTAFSRGSDFSAHQHLGLNASVRLGK